MNLHSKIMAAAAPSSEFLPDMTTKEHLSSRASTALTVLSIIFIFLYILWRFMWQYKREVTANSDIPSSTSPPPPCPLPKLQREGIKDFSSLPVFVHLSTSDAERMECVVCLMEFKDRETGRIVPSCGHGFHAECIGKWLQHNSTCPLCRAVVTATMSSLLMNISLLSAPFHIISLLK